MTLVSEDAAHNSLQMSSSRDLIDVSEDAAHKSDEDGEEVWQTFRDF